MKQMMGQTSKWLVASVVVVATGLACGAPCATEASCKEAMKKIVMPLPAGTKTIEVGGSAQIKTLEDAFARVREIRKTDKKTPLALRVAPGDYAPATPLVVTREVGCTNMAPLFVFAADFSNKPRIHGGTPIAGWKKVPFNGRTDVWMADVSQMKLPKRPRLLFFNGTRMHPARWPNLDKNEPYSTGFAFARKIKGAKYYEDQVIIETNDVRTWKHPEDGWATLHPEHNYWSRFMEVTALTNGVLCMEAPHRVTPGYNRWDRYCVENIAEELDQPGEWYFDPRVKKAYIIAPGGIDPNKTVVAFPKPEPIITVRGGGNCTFAGLELTAGNDGIRIIGGADTVDVIACSIHDIGYYGFGGMHAACGIFAMALNINITDCDIYNIGNHGVMIHGYGVSGPDDRMNVVVENNYIHHCGEVDPAGQAVRNSGQGVRVSHNLMHDFPRSAICGYGRFSETSYNYIRHTNMTGDDTGALYDAAWTSCVGSKICYNWISDSIGYKRDGDRKYRFFWNACGIYMDECSGGLEVYGNHIERCHWAAMHLHNARWSTISNNVFVSNGTTPLSMYTHQFSISPWNRQGFGTGRRKMYGGEYHSLVDKDPRWKKHPALAQDPYTDEVFSKSGSMTMGIHLVNNIFYYPDQGWSGHAMCMMNFDISTNRIDRNVYWNKHGDWSIWTNGWAASVKWDAWQKSGADVNSVVADPLFVNPSKKDYRLKPESPAFKMGFVELPYEKMGLKVTKFRPFLPKEAEGLREHPEWLRPRKKK